MNQVLGLLGTVFIFLIGYAIPSLFVLDNVGYFSCGVFSGMLLLVYLSIVEDL